MLCDQCLQEPLVLLQPDEAATQLALNQMLERDELFGASRFEVEGHGHAVANAGSWGAKDKSHIILASLAASMRAA